MHVGILSCPQLFQRDTDIQVRIRETMTALRKVRGPGIAVDMLDPCAHRLDELDLIHVFSAVSGNHRVVEAAVEAGVPVLLSPLVSSGWDRASGARARVGDRLLGKLTAWCAQSSYAQTRCALQLADLVLAHDMAEQEAICSAFLVPQAKLRVVPCGVSPRFFSADGELFRGRTGIGGPFVLMAGPIGPAMRQLELAQALADLALPLIVIGSARERDVGYFDALRRVPGTTCLGPLAYADPLYASAFAAASLVAWSQQGEAAPVTLFAALAAGTPLLIGRAVSLPMASCGFAVHMADWTSTSSLQRAAMSVLASPPVRTAVRALVREHTWVRVAGRIADCYAELLRLRQRSSARAV